MWINIKEKLPKRYEPVLTYGRGYGFEVQYLEVYEDDWFSFSKADQVDFWQLLPKTPKYEGDLEVISSFSQEKNPQ